MVPRTQSTWWIHYSIHLLQIQSNLNSSISVKKPSTQNISQTDIKLVKRSLGSCRHRGGWGRLSTVWRGRKATHMNHDSSSIFLSSNPKTHNLLMFSPQTKNQSQNWRWSVNCEICHEPISTNTSCCCCFANGR